MPRIALLTVAGAALAVRLFVAWALPLGVGTGDPNCAPDETAHFLVVRELASGGARTWPRVPSSESLHLPTQYAVQAALFAVGRYGVDRPALYRFTGNPNFRGYFFARLGNVLLGVLTAVMLAEAAAVWTGSSTAGMLAGLAIAFYPQHVFVSSYVNSDAMTIAAGAALVWALARWARSGEGAIGLSALGAGIGFVVLGRVNGYALLPPTLAWVAAAIRRGRISLTGAVRATGIALAICLPVLMFNAIRNDGDPLGLFRYRGFMARDWHVAPPPPDAVRAFAVQFSASSFALFRNMDLPVDRWSYAAASAFLVVGLASAVLRARDTDATTRAGALWMIASATLSLGLVLYYSWRVDFAPQGRYALLPTMLLTLTAVVAPVRMRSARPWRPWPVAYVAFLFAATMHALSVIYRNPCVG